MTDETKSAAAPSPIDELAAMDLDALWQRALGWEGPGPARDEAIREVVARQRQAYAHFQAVEEAKLAEGETKRKRKAE